MENIFNRLQFVRGINPNNESGVFETREDAVSYVINKHLVERPALAGEPIFLLYESDDAAKGPNVILAIGSVGNGTANQANRTFFIDTQKTEEEIAELDEKIEEAIKSLTLIPLESDTIKLNTEKTEEGTLISGDVKVADYRIVSGKVNENIIEVEGNKGIYAFVDMDYDPETFIITFTVNGTTKEFQLPKDQHVESGWYDPKEESIFVKLADGTKVKILVTKLIEEWTVLPDGQTINEYNVSGTTVKYTPIVFAKTHVGASATEHEGIYDWQDVLEADIRVADHISDNILHKDRTGRYLYVKGTADNIIYQPGVTVKDAIDGIDTRVSTSTGNLIYKRADGIYATAMLDYNTAENRIIYRYSEGNTGELKEISFQLNSVKLLEDITYDSTREVIVIRYIDAQGEYQRVEIPAADIIEEWIVNNEAHNIELNKYRSEGQGKDVLTADAKIHSGNNNILEDLNHELYVNGIADNIKYDVTGATTVKDVLDNLSATTDALDEKIDQEIADREASDERFENLIGTGFTTDPHDNITYKFESLSAKVDSEIERATSAETELSEKLDAEIERSTEKDTEHDTAIETINNTIGTGFTDDPHENVTYKFETLSAKVDTESERLTSEIERSTEKDTEHDEAIQRIDYEIGSGFSITNTVRDEINNINDTIEELSANTEGRLQSVVNEDHSINVDNTDPVNPVISVNLSEEVEDGKPNIIKLNTDGLYAGVDLEYVFDGSSNQLIFRTTNETKVFELKTNSVVDKIYYDPTREAIIVEYTVNGHRMPDVVIPVGDLINEWRVWDGHEGAVQLSKTRVASGSSEQDVLYAEVVISDHDDNIIVNDSGALYVSGSGITANATEIELLKDRMDIAEADINTLQDGLDAEIARATAAEEDLREDLDEEIARSTAKDAELEEKIDNEIARSTSADTALQNALNEEIVRATSAETALQTAINDEVTRATNEESRIETKLDNEIARSTEKDTELETALNNEIARSTSADTALQNALNEEIVRAMSAETEISSELNAEITRATNKENELETAINNEVARATSVEDGLRSDLNAEIERSINKDNELETAINNEVVRAMSAETALQTAIDNEATTRQTEDTRIETKLDNEIARATSADTELQTAINDVTSNLTNEIARATSAETAIRNALLEEVERATIAENNIENDLALEAARAAAAEAALQVAIDTETANRIHGDEDLQLAIDTEATRATNAESALQTAINNEVTRATNAESALQTAITNETLRANSADTQLYQSIADETAARISADADLQSQVNQETSRAQVAETTISERLGAEINRSTLEDQAIRDLLSAETAARQEGDEELEEAIRNATLTFDDTTSIDFTKTTGNVVTADVKLQEGDNIIKLGQGLYASVHLSYDPGTNKIKLVTSNGDDEEIQLVGASLLEDLYYDPVNKELVITYKDATGEEHTVRFGVSELFNEWSVNNPSEKSAVELTKTPATEPGGEDKLSGRVLITDDRDGDGKPDEGSDNLIEIRNNGLYVNGSAFSAATATTECVQTELKAVENAIFGRTADDCGDGFTYTPPMGSVYINSATTINNATYILDQAINNLSSYTVNVEETVETLSGDVDCLRSELDITQENVLGMAVPNCGLKGDGTPFTYQPNQGTNYIFSSTSFNNTDIILDRELKAANDNITNISGDINTVSGDVINNYAELQCLENGVGFGTGTCEYTPDVSACFISGASSLMDADKILDREICQLAEDIENLFIGTDTVSTHMYAETEHNNRYLKTDVRLSRGNTQPCQEDADVMITDLSDEDFSDTNALRIVDVTGLGYRIDACYNGVFLSNRWSCGEYTENGEGTPGNKYQIDDSASASNIDYMNNVR